jgi:hypothetical protein
MYVTLVNEAHVQRQRQATHSASRRSSQTLRRQLICSLSQSEPQRRSLPLAKRDRKGPKIARHLNELEEDALLWSHRLKSGGSGSMLVPPKKGGKGPNRLRRLTELEEDALFWSRQLKSGACVSRGTQVSSEPVPHVSRATAALYVLTILQKKTTIRGR